MSRYALRWALKSCHTVVFGLASASNDWARSDDMINGLVSVGSWDEASRTTVEEEEDDEEGDEEDSTASREARSISYLLLVWCCVPWWDGNRQR